MKDEDKIKDSARAKFEEENYEDAFTILLKELDVDSFFAYIDGKKRQRITDKFPKSANYFWNTFVLEEDNFQTLFTSKIVIELLYIYYSRTTIFSKAFEIKLSQTFPELFVNVIRLNQVFLKKERLDFLLDEVALPENLELHKDVWEFIYDRELLLWKQIDSLIHKIAPYTPKKILHSAVYVIENRSFHLPQYEEVDLLASTYNFFIELLHKYIGIAVETLPNSEAFTGSFIKDLLNDKQPNKKLNILVIEIFKIISLRVQLFTNCVDPYSYDLHTEPKISYESMYLVTQPELHYKWRLDRIRYDVIDLFYQSRGEEYTTQLIEDGKYTLYGNTEQHRLLNKILAAQTQAVLKILKDLELTTVFYKEALGKSEIIIPLLFTFAYNRYVRYDIRLKEIKESNSKYSRSWRLALIFLNIESGQRGVAQDPFLYLTRDEYEILNKKTNPIIDDDTTDILIDLYGTEIDASLPFDRFDIKYDVHAKPFLKLGDYYFCPVRFFTSFTSLYIHVAAMLYNNGRKTGKKIEVYLAELLKIHGLNVFVPTKTQEEKMKGKGDADLIVYDDDKVLLMQLKRTRIRLTAEGRYNEYLNTDLGAARQLNKIERFLNNENDVFEIKNRKVTKWIVSSSLENVNTLIDDCLKVSYLDIVCFLLNEEGMTFETLYDFISFYKEDTLLQTYLSNVNNSYVIEDPNSYLGLLFDYDTEKATKYRRHFNKALQYDNEERRGEAIKELDKCLHYENEDPRIYSVLARVFWGMKKYEDAFVNFEKALELLPNDPFIMVNYMRVLNESGYTDKAEALYETFYEKYSSLKVQETF